MVTNELKQPKIHDGMAVPRMGPLLARTIGIVALIGVVGASFAAGRWQQHRADLPAMTASARAIEAADTIAAAEFRGRHSGQALTLGVVDVEAKDAIQRVSNAYVFLYTLAGQEYRETLTGGIWQTSVKVTPDAEKPEQWQWVPIEAIQAVQQLQATGDAE